MQNLNSGICRYYFARCNIPFQPLFTLKLLANPSTTSPSLTHVVSIHFDITHSEVFDFEFSLPPSQPLDDMDPLASFVRRLSSLEWVRFSFRGIDADLSVGAEYATVFDLSHWHAALTGLPEATRSEGVVELQLEGGQIMLGLFVESYEYKGLDFQAMETSRRRGSEPPALLEPPPSPHTEMTRPPLISTKVIQERPSLQISFFRDLVSSSLEELQTHSQCRPLLTPLTRWGLPNATSHRSTPCVEPRTSYPLVQTFHPQPHLTPTNPCGIYLVVHRDHTFKYNVIIQGTTLQAYCLESVVQSNSTPKPLSPRNRVAFVAGPGGPAFDILTDFLHHHPSITHLELRGMEIEIYTPGFVQILLSKPHSTWTEAPVRPPAYATMIIENHIHATRSFEGVFTSRLALGRDGWKKAWPRKDARRHGELPARLRFSLGVQPCQPGETPVVRGAGLEGKGQALCASDAYQATGP